MMAERAELTAFRPARDLSAVARSAEVEASPPEAQPECYERSESG